MCRIEMFRHQGELVYDSPITFFLLYLTVIITNGRDKAALISRKKFNPTNLFPL